ncbi:hypothetical protein BH11GEM2_BH11GEM2_29360 [soil metagenome]
MIPLRNAVVLALLVPLCLGAQVIPLEHAHAHNDYEHTRPLAEALEHGFTSVEADIWLVDGQLLVAHDRDKVDSSRTRARAWPARPILGDTRHRARVGPPPLGEGGSDRCR